MALREVKNIPSDRGVVTEIYRRDWKLDEEEVDQAFQVLILPGGISAWHAHQVTTDRLFVSMGLVRIVLYDPRRDSPTYGMVNEFRLGPVRPGLLVVPPKVWHGVQNMGAEAAVVVNLSDRAYRYEDPDHWRLPPGSPEIAYRFPPSAPRGDRESGPG